MGIESFSLNLKLDGQSEQIRFSDRQLEYSRKIDNVISIDIVFKDGFQKFVRAFENFACNCVKKGQGNIVEDKPVIEVKFNSDGGVFEGSFNFSKSMPEGWQSCALALVQMLNENTLFCKLADAMLFDN